MIVIPEQAKEIMMTDAVAAYPDECCGFFFGTEADTGDRLITEVHPVVNAKEGDKRRRFEISPLDYLRAEQYAEESGLLVLGIYHSHPDHPAIPSETDRVAAQPWFSYLILSVMHGKVEAIRSWRLNEGHQFEEETIHESGRPEVGKTGRNK